MANKTRATLLIVLMTLCFNMVRAQDHPDFSGTWKLDGKRSVPERNGDVTLAIVHRDPLLKVETTIVRGSAAPRHAVQDYRTDGKTSVSTGADGDEFHTAIVWQGQNLAFTITEHEDGRILESKETWSLAQNGATLQRIREMPDGKKQTLVYVRQP
jgi:hypothetical protein